MVASQALADGDCSGDANEPSGSGMKESRSGPVRYYRYRCLCPVYTGGEDDDGRLGKSDRNVVARLSLNRGARDEKSPVCKTKIHRG